MSNLKIFLNLLNTQLDIICICESKLLQKLPQTTNIQLSGYNTEHTLTTLAAGKIQINY